MAREATDFTPSVLAAWETAIREIEAGIPPGSVTRTPGPVWALADGRLVRRLGALWFRPFNCRLYVHESGRRPEAPRQWVVAGVRMTGRVRSIELVLSEPPDLELFEWVAQCIGLLPDSAA